MEYGFCSGFATNPTFVIDNNLYPRIKDAGYDFVELPLMSVTEMDETEFLVLNAKLKLMDLGCTSMCNLFPSKLSLFWDDDQKLNQYLEKALKRAKAMGVRKICFGSGGFRSFPQGINPEEAYERLVTYSRDCIAPMAEEAGIPVLIEPLNPTEANLINSVKEGARLVQDVDKPFFGLMVDLYHMSLVAEPIGILKSSFDMIGHVHLCNRNRALPLVGFDPYIESCLVLLKQLRYEGTVSYESEDGPGSALDGARKLLKRFL